MTEKQLVNGRIVGGYSAHTFHDTTKCSGGMRHRGVWRTVECGGLAGSDTDIIECSSCGEQKRVSCSFDEEYS